MTGLKLIDALVLRMRDLQERQGVISQNIANADTPGYRTRDLRSPDFADLLDVETKGGIRKPHIELSSSMRAVGRSHVTTVPGDASEEKPNGNNVSLEDQVLTMGQIQSDYQAATSLYRKSMGLLKIAIGR